MDIKTQTFHAQEQFATIPNNMDNFRRPRTQLLFCALSLLVTSFATAQQSSVRAPIPDTSTSLRTPSVIALAALAATLPKKSLYDRLGGVFAISAVMNHFSDALIENPMVGRASKNPALKEWSTKHLDRLPGLKFMRTLWVCNITGGPFTYTPTKPGKTKLGLEKAHQKFKISSKEFDEVAAELGRSLDFYKVPAQEKKEVLAAFAAHKHEVLGG